MNSYLAAFALHFHFSPRQIDEMTLVEFDLLADQIDDIRKRGR